MTEPKKDPEKDPKVEGKAKAEKAAPKPDWQDPDYDGPLDGEQAMWRNKHIKRLNDGHATKPVKSADATK